MTKRIPAIAIFGATIGLIAGATAIALAASTETFGGVGAIAVAATNISAARISIDERGVRHYHGVVTFLVPHQLLMGTARAVTSYRGTLMILEDKVQSKPSEAGILSEVYAP